MAEIKSTFRVRTQGAVDMFGQAYPLGATVEVRTVSPNGDLWEHYFMNDNHDYIGLCRWWHRKTEEIHAMENYDHLGRKHGQQLLFYPSGNLLQEQKYDRGAEVSDTIIYADSLIRLKIERIRHRKHRSVLVVPDLPLTPVETKAVDLG